jgi:hypothetical protein
MTTKMQPKAGQYVCFLAKNKKAREYGVLVRDLRTIDTFGTCIMHSSNNVGVAATLQTFPAKDLHVAWLRFNNLDNSSADKKAMPRNGLRNMYNSMTAHQQQLLKK